METQAQAQETARLQVERTDDVLFRLIDQAQRILEDAYMLAEERGQVTPALKAASELALVAWEEEWERERARVAVHDTPQGTLEGELGPLAGEWSIAHQGPSWGIWRDGEAPDGWEVWEAGLTWEEANDTLRGSVEG